MAEAVYELRKAELKDKEVDIIDEPTAGQLLNNLYRDPYESVIDKMLHFFLPKVSELHLKAQDSDILYREIAKLFLKMLLQPGIQDLKKSTNQKLNYIVMTSEDDIMNYASYFQKYPNIRQLSSRFWCKRGVTKNNKGFPRGVSELGIILFLKMKDNIVILSRYC